MTSPQSHPLRRRTQAPAAAPEASIDRAGGDGAPDHGAPREDRLTTFTVLRFPTAEGAERTLATLERPQREELIKVHDAAIVSWPADRKKPKTRQLHSLAGAGALGGAFWGLLFGLIFLIPLLVRGHRRGDRALTGALTDAGIDDKFIKEVREKVTPGTSALFVMTSTPCVDKVRAELKGTDAELIHTNLSGEDEARLREAFSYEA